MYLYDFLVAIHNKVHIIRTLLNDFQANTRTYAVNKQVYGPPNELAVIRILNK